MESELLRYLVQNAGHPVSRKAILENVWDLQEDTDTRAIDNFIVRLRKYIEDESSNPRHLVTVRGLG
jgi:DNA-binding response OmpR family regulator